MGFSPVELVLALPLLLLPATGTFVPLELCVSLVQAKKRLFLVDPVQHSPTVSGRRTERGSARYTASTR